MSNYSFLRYKKFFKITLSLLLSITLILIPYIQRYKSYAVAVETITVVTVLVLTIMTAMGITLVVTEGDKESFLQSKYPQFMTDKGYTGTFENYVGDLAQTGLKVGMLYVAKTAVDKIKEFIDWLIPGAVSNTVVDLSQGASTGNIADYIICDGYVTNGVMHITEVGTIVHPTITGESISANGNILRVFKDGSKVKVRITGGYNSYNASPAYLNDYQQYSLGSSNYVTLFRLTEQSSYNGVTYMPGIYTCLLVSLSSTTSSSPLDRYFPFSLSDVIVDSTEAAAMIGDYDDLSNLTNQTVTDGGTTIINNSFYITQDGQALNPSGETLDDIINALRQSLDDLNSKLDVIPQTAVTEAEGTVTPDYSDFDLGDLDLSGLGALLTTRFPFSIPWDIIRIFQTFVAEPEAPSWTVDLLPIEQFENVNTEITIDLGQYPLVGQISRYFCIIELCIGLCYITKRLVWTA